MPHGRVRAGFEEQLNRLAGWIDDVLKSTRHRPALSSYELARTVMALSQGFAQQPAERAAVRGVMRTVLGTLLGQEEFTSDRRAALARRIR